MRVSVYSEFSFSFETMEARSTQRKNLSREIYVCVYVYIYIYLSIYTVYLLYNIYYMKKEMATHSIILDWEIQWTEELGGLHPVGWQRVSHDLATKQQHKYI